MSSNEPTTEIEISTTPQYLTMFVKHGPVSRFRTLLEALDFAELNEYHAFRIKTEDGTEAYARVPVEVYATSENGGPLKPHSYRAAW